MKWSEKYRINICDTDMNRVVSASGILKYLQDAATRQMLGEGPSYDELLDSNLSFILSRIRISMYAPLYKFDEITAQSWACESHGVSFMRCYRILKNDAIVAEAVSTWALVNTVTGRLTKVSDVDLHYSYDEMLELDAPARIHIPSDIALKLAGEHTVVYDDVDLNRHMNNTRYPDMLCGFIPEMDGSRVISIGLSYMKEAPLGETVKVYVGKYDGVYYFRTVKPDGTTNVEAEIITEDINEGK